MRKPLVLGACLIGAALLLVACGSSESDEDKITSAIEAFSVSTDPADCTALVTVAFLEETEFEVEGQEAVESCEEDAEDDSENPDSVTVSDVEVDGSSATASVAFVGSSFDGQTLTIGLVEEDGDWKLDSIEGFAEFDKAKLIASIEEGLSGADGVEDRIVSCLVEKVESSSDAEAEEFVLEQDVFREVFEGCE